jgi:tyrosine-protein phosphatase non-receptor type 11
MKNTVAEFWEMVWQEETRIIAMTTNLIEGGKVRTETYQKH